jgi:hypothetical protein
MTSKDWKRQLRQQQTEAFERQQRAALKHQRRAEKALARMQQDTQDAALPVIRGALHCACLIHSTGYDWTYVDRLYNMIVRNLNRDVIFHVYTEESRAVPAHMTKHVLKEWPGQWGARKSWWYKIQLFNSNYYQGPLLYFDLDTVIVGRLDWITELPTKFLWAPKDYRYLWKPSHQGINSSVMWWDTTRFDWVWRDFDQANLGQIMRHYNGDQDYISEKVPPNNIRTFLPMSAMSWRWQVKDGGMNFKTRQYQNPNSGTHIDSRTSILVFHGSPKPHEVKDPVIENFWR